MPSGKQIEERIVPLVKVGPKHQVVIPKAVRTKLGVDPGDYVEVAFQRDHATIRSVGYLLGTIEVSEKEGN